MYLHPVWKWNYEKASQNNKYHCNQEAVYWQNVTLKDDVLASSVQAEMIHTYYARVKGIDTVLLHEWQHKQGMYKEGNHV